jgi:hypothetical protein
MIEQRDLDAVAMGRLATQYRNSEKLKGMISLYISELTEAPVAIFEALALLNLDHATGWALDVLGAVLGLPRPFIDGEAFEYFGFDGDPTAIGFGDVNDPAAGGRFASVFSSLVGQVPLEDEDYRPLLRAKSVKNQGDASPENVLAVIAAAFTGTASVSPVEISEGPTARAVITLGRWLSATEKALLRETNLIEGPICVDLKLAESAGDDAFGFAGGPGLGFGDVGNAATGGFFASLI